MQLDIIAQCDEVRRLSRQCESILLLLLRGPQTGADLAAVTHRFSARIHELRKAGYKIVLTHHDRATGQTVYELERPHVG